MRRLVLQHLEHILQWPLHLLATHQVATRPILRGAKVCGICDGLQILFEAWWPNEKAWTYTLNCRRDQWICFTSGDVTVLKDSQAKYSQPGRANSGYALDAGTPKVSSGQTWTCTGLCWLKLISSCKLQGTPRKFGAPAASPSSRRRTEMFLCCKA